MTATFKNYDPARVVASFRGVPFLGYKDGTFLKAARSEDTFSMDVGSTGDVTRVRSRNATGMVTLTIQAASPTNDLLSGVALEDEVTGLGFGPLLIKDLNGTTLVAASIAWIQKPADFESAKDASSREWTFACAELETFIGGAVI